MLIKGDIIPFNRKKIIKFLQIIKQKDELYYLFLYGKLCKKEKEFQKANNFFLQST